MPRKTSTKMSFLKYIFICTKRPQELNTCCHCKRELNCGQSTACDLCVTQIMTIVNKHQTCCSCGNVYEYGQGGKCDYCMV